MNTNGHKGLFLVFMDDEEDVFWEEIHTKKIYKNPGLLRGFVASCEIILPACPTPAFSALPILKNPLRPWRPLREIILSADGDVGAAQNGAKGNRTPDLLNAIEALYQLSYDPVKSKFG